MADKLATLKRYRRAKGLCDLCAENWSRDHRCAATVQLHVVQELLELFSLDTDVDTASIVSEGQLFVALSKDAFAGSSGPRTIRFSGTIQQREVSILIDSGSSHSFIAKQIADNLSGVFPMASAIMFKWLIGGVMECTSHLPLAQWSVQGHHFVSDLKVLPLSTFDLIIGMDWLEEHSRMQIHWLHKWIQFSHHGNTVCLQGTLPQLPEMYVIQLCSLDSSHTDINKQHELPPEIEALLTEFASVLAPISGLPPARDCDHVIPLVPGTKRVHVRLYRYPPALKDEIEAQMADMLDKGLVQVSNSEFASPILLVKKKDGSWHFCVDYRYLNAVTIKSKFPILVFDQLMDELAKASWFSTIDFSLGYHQVRLNNGEEYKTAFQTHHSHFEFKVVAFGLCGAPGTFQGAMNTALAPFLRRCVVVFFDDILVYSNSFEDHLQDLKAVLQLLAEHQWQMKLSKCSFAKTQINYLGHVIRKGSLATDPCIIQAVLQWPQPSNVKELRSFLGLAGYYRKFVRFFAVFVRSLTSLLKKNTLFVWTSEHAVAFQELKSALCSSPVLCKIFLFSL